MVNLMDSAYYGLDEQYNDLVCRWMCLYLYMKLFHNAVQMFL